MRIYENFVIPYNSSFCSRDVEITNTCGKQINGRLIKKISQKILSAFGKKNLSEISLVFVSADKIRRINKKYRRQDKPTDVLSFEDLNEIFICPAIVKKDAKTQKIPYSDHLTRVITHGILHLKGYDHEKNKKQEKRMRAAEKAMLKKILPAKII